MANRIHHINFLVRELSSAIEHYVALLGCKPVIEELPARGVKSARFKVGESWIVLLQPTSTTGAPAAHLREHGEGFFMISYGCTDLDAKLQELSANGLSLSGQSPRQGLANWRVRDVDNRYNVLTQFTEELG